MYLQSISHVSGGARAQGVVSVVDLADLRTTAQHALSPSGIGKDDNSESEAVSMGKAAD
jgi:hypothetical protein